MLPLENIYTLYFRLYFRLCICLNKLAINQYDNLVIIFKLVIDYEVPF